MVENYPEPSLIKMYNASEQQLFFILWSRRFNRGLNYFFSLVVRSRRARIRSLPRPLRRESDRLPATSSPALLPCGQSLPGHHEFRDRKDEREVRDPARD